MTATNTTDSPTVTDPCCPEWCTDQHQSDHSEQELWHELRLEHDILVGGKSPGTPVNFATFIQQRGSATPFIGMHVPDLPRNDGDWDVYKMNSVQARTLAQSLQDAADWIDEIDGGERLIHDERPMGGTTYLLVSVPENGYDELTEMGLEELNAFVAGDILQRIREIRNRSAVTVLDDKALDSLIDESFGELVRRAVNPDGDLTPEQAQVASELSERVSMLCADVQREVERTRD